MLFEMEATRRMKFGDRDLEPGDRFEIGHAKARVLLSAGRIRPPTDDEERRGQRMTSAEKRLAIRELGRQRTKHIRDMRAPATAVELEPPALQAEPETPKEQTTAVAQEALEEQTTAVAQEALEERDASAIVATESVESDYEVATGPVLDEWQETPLNVAEAVELEPPALQAEPKKSKRKSRRRK